LFKNKIGSSKKKNNNGKVNMTKSSYLLSSKTRVVITTIGIPQNDKKTMYLMLLQHIDHQKALIHKL
jgi:phage terminase Nu1 subunit (DNA packaging protein)